ncbi:flavocytochrome c [Bacillus tuaregi]|uniref:flavocytochrome c n=1 Tax=Bacillus tuaregi TaxID=1816695 RepID=UPI0008F8CD7B|nr:flavocytochrome c [Bacillus tuaregi]
MMRKRKLRALFSVMLIMFLLVSLIGCGQKDKDDSESSGTSTKTESTFKAGTYTGVGKGNNGDIKVEVEVDDDSILAINVLEHNETKGLSDAAFDEIPNTVIEGQTLAVDTVSGATNSSNGLIEAITEALKAAGGDINELSKNKATNETAREDKEYTTDVVVIGAGGAGLAAAVSAHENGAKVIVLEKMPQPGGNTIISGAAYNAVDPVRQSKQGIEDSVDKHYTQTYEGGDMKGDPELVRTLVENAYPTLQWLEGLGMEFTDEVFTVLGGLWPRAHKPVKPLGTGYIETYMSYIEKSNDEIQVLVNTEAKELIVENDVVVGVKAEGKNGNVVVNAKSVVMAAGGFGANVDMRNEYNSLWPDLTNLKTTNHPGATGDGIAMGEQVEANLVGMEYIQLLPMGDPETGSLSGNIEQGVENRIFVNKDGNRFVDEGARRDVMTKALMEQSDQTMWVIVDKHSYPTGDTKNNFNESIDDLVAAGRAYKADTLEDLAKQIGVDSASFVKAVEGFNNAVDAGTDEFGRTLFDQKLDTAPFYAGARVPTVHHTMGGLQINTDAQVLNKEGQVIKGLYAAGEVTGGIHGTNRLGGNALADVNTFGRIAGQNAAIGK